MTPSYDPSRLRKTSDNEWTPWRAHDVTMIRIAVDGTITQAGTITEKRQMIEDAADEDCLLLAWPGQYRQDIFWIDDRAAAAEGLAPPSRRST